MTTRTHAPAGAPCWADLWTSDVDGIRRFYGELFGWEATEPEPQFGGYFQFLLDGAPVAGCMGDMPDMPARDIWKPYLATDDVARTAEAAAAAGATILSPPMPVADLGIQLVLDDPTGAHLGAWQPVTFPGFTVLEVPGAPSWFELRTRDHDGAVDFYRSVFRWETTELPGEHQIAYSLLRDPNGEGTLAGIMDAATLLADGVPASWAISWEVEDAHRTAEAVGRLGGKVVAAPEETPFGVLATATDPAGAEFKLRAANR